MALFGQKRRLGKIIRIIALVTALSTACSKKNDEFVGLVSRGDRPVASKIVDKGGKKFNEVNGALYRIKTKLRSYGIWANQWKERPKPFGSSTSFGYYQSFADQLGSRLDDFNYPFMGGKYTNEFVVELESLKEAGLEATAKQLRIELVELHLNIDDAFAYRIKETVKSMLPVVNEKLDESESGRYMYARGIRTVYDAIKRYRILELLKEVADKASRAGYEKTSEAANWSVLELQAAMK